MTSNLRLDNLGVQITWMGKRGMRWGELIVFRKKIARFPPFAYLLIHLGGNDITTTKDEELYAQNKHDICVID